MKKITLNSIRESIEQKYAPLEIEVDDKTTVRLIPPLRLPDADLQRIQDIAEASEREDDEDNVSKITDQLQEIVMLAADDKATAKRLIEAVSGDRAILAEIVETYFKAQSVGEASPSQS